MSAHTHNNKQLDLRRRAPRRADSPGTAKDARSFFLRQKRFHFLDLLAHCIKAVLGVASMNAVARMPAELLPHVGWNSGVGLLTDRGVPQRMERKPERLSAR